MQVYKRKKQITVVLISIISFIAICIGINSYNKYITNKYIIDYVNSHKDVLYNKAFENSVHTDNEKRAIEKYKFHIDNEIYSKQEDVKNKLSMEFSNTDIKVDLADYITFDNITIDGVQYELYEFKQNYFKDSQQKKVTIDFNINIDVDNLSESVLDILKSSININMQGATGKIKDSSMIVTTVGLAGKSVEEESLVDQLNNFKTKTFSDLYKSYRYDVDITVQDVAVYPTEKDIADITDKIASFSTGYGNSSSSRKTNINIAAQKLNGIILLPGQQLSIDKAIGSRNAKNGYAKAGSYLNGKTVQTYGGGVCQVSTTLYGAVLRAGLIPVTRNAHSMSVGYVPLGLDAAISEGYKDLVIENTYDSPIYIEAKSNGSLLEFNIWGKDGITEGLSFKPKNRILSDLKAEAYLEVYKGRDLIETKKLNSSSYKKHS